MLASTPRRLRALIVFPLLLLMLLTASLATAQPQPLTSRQLNRDRLLSFILRQQLVMDHYSHKLIDDHLSEAAFGLYLKQLDAQKRFLLKSDVDELTAYKDRIDDEIYQGRMKLPVVSAQIMARRIPAVRKMAGEILAQPFDFDRKESFQTDPDKLDYCQNAVELRERWRKILKFQVINRYLDLKEDQAADSQKTKPLSDAELRHQARQKVLASLDDLFDRMSEETEQDYFDRYFDAIARAFDPHTDYFPPEQKEDFDISMRGSLEGIGATLREEDGYIKVVSIIPGGPAARQGELQPGDTILKVAQGNGEPVEITDIQLRDAVNLIRGKKGTLVKLTVRRADGRRLVIPIVRDVVQIEQTFVKSTTVTDAKSKKTFGYVLIPSFYRDFKHIQEGKGGRNVTADVRRALEKLRTKNINGLILDLRNDGGGALTDAVSVAGLFIKTGPVVQVRSSDGSIQVLADHDPSIEYGGPMVVLVNRFSASASEILAGALQDYHRALIVGGGHTHGKGTVQALLDLDRAIPFKGMDDLKPLGALKITVQKFYRITGESTQYRGVIPDIVLPDPLSHLKTGEKYLEYSLPWDTVAATDYTPWPHPVRNLAAIVAASHKRVAADPRFAAMSAEAKLSEERMKDTHQPLDLADIIRERKEARQLEDRAGADFHGSALMPLRDRKKVAKTPEEERKLWTDAVSVDPYVDEAEAILSDVIAQDAAPAPASAGAQ